MDIARVHNSLVQWLKDEVAAAGAQGIALGLSGGIDSAVVAGLAQRACADKVLGVIMPCHSNKQDEDDAFLVASHFGIKTQRVDLSPVYDHLLQIVGANNAQQSGFALAEANIKPRLRMVSVYYLANCNNYLVAGTDNLSEYTVGYFTKYGDGAADLQPIIKLVKREVQQLAEYLGVPRAVIDKVPSAGLWPDQTDENEMGFSYDLLDTYIRTGIGPQWLSQKVEEMRRRSEHKRNLPLAGPVGEWEEQN